MIRLATLAAMLLALLPSTTMADWSTKRQGFLRATATTAVADLPNAAGATSGVTLNVRQICVHADPDAVGGAPWTVTLYRDNAVYKKRILYPGTEKCWDFPSSVPMIDLKVQTIEQPSTSGEVVVEVEHDYNINVSAQ